MFNLTEKCRFCKSVNVLEIIEPANSTHYGRLTCSDCGRFLKWLPKPKIPSISVARLLHGTGLETWERKFLKAIACRSLTKAELIVIEAIEAKVNPVPSGRGTG